MNLTKEEKNDVLIVNLDGTLDINGVDQFNNFVGKALKKHRNLALNLKGLDFIDSTGISALVNQLTRMRQRKGKLIIFNLSKQIQEILETARLGNFLDIISEKEFNRMFPDRDVYIDKLINGVPL